MGGFKHTGAADGTVAGNYIAFNQATAVGSLTITTLSGTTFTATGNVTGAALIPSSSTIPTNGLYLKAANNPALASNTTLRYDCNSTGNHTFAAASSGITANFIASAAGTATQFTDATIFGQINFSGSSMNWGATSNSPVAVFTNNITRTTWGAAGNVTINASSSGDTLSLSNIAGQFSFVATGPSGGATQTYIRNTNNTASSTALQILEVAGGTAGDAYQRFDVSGVTNWSIGVDNSDSDSFKVSKSTGLGTNDYLNVTTDGRWYGTALHNNAGAVTGITSQYIASGTYTPTITSVANIEGTTARNFQWIRVGNVVTVSGAVNIDPIAGASTTTTIGVSLPIASNLAGIAQLSGFGGVAASSISGAVIEDTTNDRAQYAYVATSIAILDHYLTFTYVVL
jgi:hypothetical protein